MAAGHLPLIVSDTDPNSMLALIQVHYLVHYSNNTVVRASVDIAIEEAREGRFVGVRDMAVDLAVLVEVSSEAGAVMVLAQVVDALVLDDIHLTYLHCSACSQVASYTLHLVVVEEEAVVAYGQVSSQKGQKSLFACVLGSYWEGERRRSSLFETGLGEELRRRCWRKLHPSGN